MNEEVRHFSLRKLSVGLASVLVGVSIFGASQTVKADTVADQTNSAVTNNAQSSDTQENGNVSKSSFSNDNQPANAQSNLIQTQENEQKQDSVPKTQEATDSINLDAEKSIVRTSSLQKTDNQSNRTPETALQTTQNVQSFNLKQNSQKLNQKVLATNLSETTSSPMTNGGFDEATWGKLDVTKWQGSVQDGVYELTNYTGDSNHVIVPNEADFEKAGQSTNGLQVGITRDTVQSLVSKNQEQMTIAFSKTNDQKVKAIGTDWSNAFSYNSTLSKFDGSNLDVSNVTDMTYMFNSSQISDLTSLANWDVSNVTDMSGMFQGNSISNLTPLTNWNTSKVTDMSWMFGGNKISNLTPLANWNTSKVTDMHYMFIANPDLIDLRPIANWNLSNVKDQKSDQERFAGLFAEDTKLDLTNINDTSLMKAFLKDPDMLVDAIFITNNADLVKATINQDLPNLTNTAKRTITFNIPNATPKTIVQTINYKAVAPVQVDLDNQQIVKTYPVKESDWQLDTSKQNDDVIIDGVIYFKPVKIPHVNDYKAYTVPEIKGLLEPDQTVISKQQADITKPINVTVTYKLVDSNTNDAFALDNKNGLHEHANVNDNGGYDADFWGKINVDDWNYTVNGDIIEINGLKDGVSTGANDAVIVPNLDDFKLAGKDGGAKTVHISTNTLGETAKHKYYGLSKTNGNKFVTDSDLNNAFYDNSNLTHADLNSLNTGNVTDMSGMFFGTSSLTSLDVSNWDTGNVTDMEAMFGGTSVKDLDVSNWNTGKVTDMGSMFQVASNLTSLDVSKWNTGKVTNMRSMFSETSSLTSLDVSKWNTGNVTDMSEMFDDASSLTSLDVSKWNTGNVIDMSYMFFGASRLTSLDVSNWNTGNVTDMNQMFSGASSLTSLDVSKWNTGNVTGMREMFFGASSLTSLDVSKWNTGSVAVMSTMFFGASSLTSLDVSNWDTGNVIDMSYMFNNNSNLALIVNGNKFADYLVNHDSFAESNVNSDVKSVTTDNTKLLQLLTNDVQHNSATRTIVFTFPTGYSPDLTKYHLTKTGNTYQIKQSADYYTSYAQGTVLINATDDITKHHIDTTKPYKLSDTWQPNYDKLVLAHKNSDGSVSFDAIQLPKVPGYKAYIVPNKSNPALFTVSFMAVPTENKPSTPAEETPSKPSAPTDHPNNSAWTDLKHKVADALNQSDSGWTMPENNSTYTVEVPDDAAIDLSDLVIAEPIQAQTRVKIAVPKRFKLSKKHSIKHLKHRKKAVRQFKKYRL